ncbi:winged helix-turn-helix domain-containing protein [Janthinobacterium fluminis]|uniref:Crosslink repair DNA glycosylase YcaQ family protein n=1 Tax=Janthinobacterium fluminis TaxID=2987524 RepID=A0ABT5K0H9_9BURK|nr:crosslink repair DNA glycosylase YcaQ family protein [Janthinobacterium fluminis]MDC8758477.1 crosslink repair DNA glycosylase YcaQ family protein [Janthinobacterium fluminis]
MDGLTLSLPAARALHLAAQGLAQPRRGKAVKADLLAAIRQMGVLQIDTIHVVARSPYLVLWSRLGDYPQAWLEQLLGEGALFEYWAHEACFVPVEDYGLYRRRMLDPAAMGWKYSAQWMSERRADVEAVLEHIRANGPTRSADFQRSDGQGGGWWGWKPEKRSLEALFTAGVLMIARRHNFQRYYDLAERVLPHWHDGLLAAPAETGRALLLQSVKALGLAKASWIADYFRTKGERPDPAALAAEGALLRARVEGWDEPVYIHPDHAALAQRAAAGALASTVTTLLSPFDPVVWDRRRALELFGFDYRLECYTPAEKRRYGYFTLPILRRGALVGRVDAKAHRGDGVFELKALTLEPGVRLSARFGADVAGALRRLANWHGCPRVRLTQAEPQAFAALLRACLDAAGAAAPADA